ncbi:hypothetical protein [Actinacidiphila sp. bgisy144]|uniref:hypothetical protein n=1 Tax=Actinacidiphila sp. bgisy144 TaxID=3413791 RepID=UPI003EBDC8CB
MTVDADSLDASDTQLYLAGERLRRAAVIVGIPLTPGIPRRGSIQLSPLHYNAVLLLGNVVLDHAVLLTATGTADAWDEPVPADLRADQAADWLRTACALACIPGLDTGLSTEGLRVLLPPLDLATITALTLPITAQADALTRTAADLCDALDMHKLRSMAPHARGGLIHTGWMPLPQAITLLALLGSPNYGYLRGTDDDEATAVAVAALVDRLETLLDGQLFPRAQGNSCHKCGTGPAITIGPLTPSGARTLTTHLRTVTA